MYTHISLRHLYDPLRAATARAGYDHVVEPTETHTQPLSASINGAPRHVIDAAAHVLGCDSTDIRHLIRTGAVDPPNRAWLARSISDVWQVIPDHEIRNAIAELEVKLNRKTGA